MTEQPKKGLNVGVKSFVTAIAVIFILMIAVVLKDTKKSLILMLKLEMSIRKLLVI